MILFLSKVWSVAGRSMTKKAATSVPGRRVIWLGWKLVILLSLALCFFALLRLHFSPHISSSPDSFSRARTRSRVSHDNFRGPPKIAFLFLARLNLPLDFLWGSFFEVSSDFYPIVLFLHLRNSGKFWSGTLLQNADVPNFSIYIHSAPGFLFDESTSRSHFFYDRQLTNSIQVIDYSLKKKTLFG